MSSRLMILVSFLFLVTSAFSDPYFLDPNGRQIRLSVANSVDSIDVEQGKDVLVRAFMTGYEDVPLVELNPDFKSIGDVRRFYERYFDSELEHYKLGELIWIQAFEGDRLVGWATFEMETDQKDAIYMNLLAVDPNAQRRGVGKHLTFSLLSPEFYPHLREIRLLVRRVNQQGRKFYEKIGFSEFDYDRQDNFVDPALLTGLRWVQERNLDCDLTNHLSSSI